MKDSSTHFNVVFLCVVMTLNRKPASSVAVHSAVAQLDTGEDQSPIARR